MSNRLKHLSDADIVCFVDLEISQAKAKTVREHLASCAECRDRLAAIEATLGDLNDFYTAQSFQTIPSATTARSRLQRQLVINRETSSWWRQHVAGRHFYRYAIAALVVVALGLAFYGGRQILTGKFAGSEYAYSHDVPNRSLTPGAIRQVSIGEICSATDDDDLDPVVPASIQNAVLQEYGIRPGSSGKKYQIDYLVNPQLGGTNDIKNLWPEPYYQGVWNARAKDELERHLHQMVCDHTVDLTVAQREIATDWIAAYKKYIHPQAPA